MGGARRAWISLLAALCAATLAACGGGDDGSTTSPGTAEGGTAGSTAQPGGGEAENGAGEGGGAAESGGGEGSSESESKTGPGPSKGERSYAFRTPGGDNSIQEYGEEGDSSERGQAQTSIDALYKAIASGNWAEVCSKYLSARNLEQIKVLTEKSPQLKGKGCEEVLAGLNQISPAGSPDLPVDGIASLRIEGDTGFAIWRGKDGKGYALPLTRENGEWKLTALGPTPLNPGT